MAQTQVDIVGTEDVDLSVAPTRSFFQCKFKRHTPFAIEPKEIEFQGIPVLGRSCTAVIPKAGDLLVKLYLHVTLGALVGPDEHYVDDVGRAMIESVSLRMGSVTIDTLYPEYLHAWEELSVTTDLQLGQATGKNIDETVRTAWAKSTQELYVPLEFYFHGDLCNALPLLAMHTTPLDIVVNFKRVKDIVSIRDGENYVIQESDGELIKCKLLGEFAYLDSKEREIFLNKRHQYIITQLQRQPVIIPTGVTTFNIPLTFSLPVKELLIVTVKEADKLLNKSFCFTGYEDSEVVGASNSKNESFKTLGIDINSCPRVNPLGPLYFRIVQNSQNHSRIPMKVIYTYSLAVHPENAEPSGSLNFSRIDNVTLKLTFSGATAGNLHMLIFAKSINVLKLFGGVASLKWSA